MASTSYRDYLLSEHWQEFRQTAIAACGAKCQICQLPRHLVKWLYGQDFEVHHLRYYRDRRSILGAETLADVQVLCAGCHELLEQQKINAKSEYPYSKVVFHGWPAEQFYCRECDEWVWVHHEGYGKDRPNLILSPEECCDEYEHLSMLTPEFVATLRRAA